MSRLLLSILFVIYLLLVTYFCLSPPIGIKNLGSWDKLAHLLTYIGFAILSCLLAKHRKQLFFLLTLCALYGIAIEYLQSLTSYRMASMNDELANIAGLFIGFIIAKMIDYFFPLDSFNKPIKRDETMT